jgi:hypothetical protein
MEHMTGFPALQLSTHENAYAHSNILSFPVPSPASPEKPILHLAFFIVPGILGTVKKCVSDNGNIAIEQSELTLYMTEVSSFEGVVFLCRHRSSRARRLRGAVMQCIRDSPRSHACAHPDATVAASS